MRLSRFAPWCVVVVAIGIAACGSAGGSNGSADLSPAEQRGEQLARSGGCAGCHGKNFGGGAGPGWIGLAGSEVTLTDGTTVVADDVYLTTAIGDPSTQLVDGYNLKMPPNNLSDAEIADIVAYIKTLSTESTTAPSTASSADRPLAGIVREPTPAVDATTLPSLTDPGTDVEFRGDPGGLQAVYFGYTNCPDVCPTTMTDWTVALRRLPADIAAQVSTVMVTVDPERDNDVLTGYVQSFVPDAQAAGTLDADRLSAAATPFGVSYDVTTNADGEVEVAHSGFLYLVGDDGKLLVTWPFGTSSQDMAADVEQLFAAKAAGA